MSILTDTNWRIGSNCNFQKFFQKYSTHNVYGSYIRQNLPK